jgi:uncharacterized membrane protein YccC
VSAGAGRSAQAGTTAAVGQAFKRASDFDRAGISARAGLIAAIPVAAMMALGIALNSPTDAVSMGVGAMLVGVSWRAGNGPLIPPIGTMVAATVVLTLCTLAGTLSGRWPWLHLAVLVIVCLIAGLCASLGRRGIAPGTQAIIAYVVFGRFPENLANGCGLAGLVLAGGVTQTLFSWLIGVPAAWRRQRQALARAYRKLGDLLSAVDSSGAPSAGALEEAGALLSAPALFADREREALAGLVDEGRRIRLELASLASTLDQASREQPQLHLQARPLLTQARARTANVLAGIAAAIDGTPGHAAALTAAAQELSRWGAEREPLPLERVDGRLGALIGQVAAAARLAAAIDAPGGRPLPAGRQLPGGRPLLAGRPTLGGRGLAPRTAARIRADLRQIRANATLRSAPGRHALRLAVVVAGTELLTQRIALPRGYWAVVAAATVLRPSFGATFTLGAERVLGTCVGVVVASLIAVAIDPSGWGLVAVVALLAFFTYAVFPASFTAGTAMLTGVIVFLLHTVVGDSVATALDRGLDTVIGGVIGLTAYALWPTWSARSTGPLLSRLVDAQHAYMRTVLDALVGGLRPDPATLRDGARVARAVFTDADALVELSRTEPRRDDADLRAAAATLGALQRVVYAVHALRLESSRESAPPPRPELAPLRDGFDEALNTLSLALRAGGRAGMTVPPLRRLLRKIEWQAADESLRPALDELVDAVNTAAAAISLELP